MRSLSLNFVGHAFEGWNVRVKTSGFANKFQLNVAVKSEGAFE